MAEQVISRLLRHIEPILLFSGNHIDGDGVIRPIGVTDHGYTTADKKLIKVPRDYEEWAAFKRAEDVEVFNPFVVGKHMMLLGELVRRMLTTIYSDLDPDSADEDELGIDDDEDDDDDGGYVGEVALKRISGNLGEPDSVIFEYTGDKKSGAVAMGTHEDESIAIWLACVDALCRHQKRIPPEFQNTDKLVDSMERLLEKFQKERKDFIREERETEGINGEDLTGDEEDVYIRDYPDSHFLFASDNDVVLDDEYMTDGSPIIIPKYMFPKSAEEAEKTTMDLVSLFSMSSNPDFEALDDFDLNPTY